MRNERRYEYLYPDDIEPILRQSPVCYVPLGSMEWHDAHAPLGADSFIARGLCLGMAEETGGVVLPPHHWSIHGADTNDEPYVWEKAHGTLCTHDADLWEAEMRAQVAAIAGKGWQVIVLVAGHVGQPERDILERIAEERTEPGGTQVLYVYPYRYAPGDHAGRFETNVLLGLEPEVIRDTPSMGNPFCSQPASISNREEGREAVRQIVQGVAREVRDALSRSGAAEKPGCRLLDETGVEMSWTAKWVGPSGEPHPNSYFLARKRFDVGKAPDAAVLRIGADARYAVHLNGAFVASGPVRGTHRRYFADSFDVTPLLKEGENWIAVEVYCCLKPCYIMAPNRPAVLAEIGGLVATDDSWQVAEDPSHRRDAAVYTAQIGFSEWRDTGAEPEGWLTGDDRSDVWQPAEVVGTPDDFDGRVTVPRPIADFERVVIRPVAVIESGCVPDAGPALSSPDYADLMSNEPHFPSRWPNVTDPSALTRQSGVTTLSPAEGNPGTYLILNFDREVYGDLEFDVEAPAGTVMDVGHDEVLEHSGLLASRSNYRFADRFVLRGGRQTVAQRLHHRGFRYLQIVLRDFSEPVRLHSVKLLSRAYSREAAAAFCCPDLFLVELWEMCVRTVRLCSSETFMDCPWREQALWTNDQMVTNLFYLAMTGDPVFAAHNLRVSADGAWPNGLIPAVYPSQREVLFPNLPSLWTFSLYDYYWYTGDRDTLRELLPAMEKGFSLYDAWRDGDGLVPDQDGMWNFIDWGYRAAGVGLHGKTAALNMLIAAAYKRGAALESEAGNAEKAAEYSTKSCDAVIAVNAALWDASRGRYRDCTEPDGEPTSSQHPLGIGLYFDLLEEPQKSAALENILDPDLVGCELYFQHFVLAGLAANGRTVDALSVIRHLWGRMVQERSYTVWESYRGRTAFKNCGSLCHAFACAPLYVLQSVVLGVKPLSPGFAEFLLAPRLGDLSRAHGCVPTPHGRISVSAVAGPEGKVIVTLTVPPGTQARTPDGRSFGPGDHEVEIA